MRIYKQYIHISGLFALQIITVVENLRRLFFLFHWINDVLMIMDLRL